MNYSIMILEGIVYIHDRVVRIPLRKATKLDLILYRVIR